MILTEACGDHKTTQWYLTGTQPTELCPIHSSSSSSSLAVSRLEKEMFKTGLKYDFEFERSPLKLDLDFLDNDYFFENALDDENQNNFDDMTESVEINIDYDYNYLME